MNKFGVGTGTAFILMRCLLLVAGDSQLQLTLCSALALSCCGLEAGLTCRLLRSPHRRHPSASWSLPAILLLCWSTSVTSEISFEPLRNRNIWELVYAVETYLLPSADGRQKWGWIQIGLLWMAETIPSLVP